MFRLVFSCSLVFALAACEARTESSSDGGSGADGGGDVMDASSTVQDSGTEPSSTDAGSGSDAGFYGATRCPGSGLYVCDEFETGFDPSVWTVEQQGGTVAVDSTKAARGTHSMHLTVTPAGSKALLHAKSTYPLTNTHLWGRMFLFIPRSAESSLTSHSNFVTAYGINSSGGGAVYGAAVGSKNFFGLFYQVNGGIDEASFQFHPSTPFTAVPLDRWFCFEWDFSGKDNQLRLFLDGDLIPSSVIEMRAAPATAELRVGSEFDIAEMWMDSVALSANRIGCSQ